MKPRPSLLLRIHTTSRPITTSSSLTPDRYRLPAPPLQRQDNNEALTVEFEFSPDLPLSPLVEFPELYSRKKIPYSKRHPKLHPSPAGPNCAPSAQSAALKFNPFANILASPVRNAVPHQLRIPSFLLLKFNILRQPPAGVSETDNSEILSSPDPQSQRALLLPINILPSTISRQTTVRGSYAACRRTVLETFMKKSGWKRLIHEDDCPGISKLEWRRDTPAYTQRGIQTRLVWELERMMKVLRHGSVVEGSGVDKKVGCLLVWPGEGQGTEQRSPGYVGPVQTLPDGSTVPVHDIPWMFPGLDGSMSAEEVKKLLGLDPTTTQAAILLHHQTYKAQMWLMKLRYYLS